MPRNALTKEEWKRRAAIGRQLYEKRATSGLTRQECADRCGLKLKTYDAAENTRHSNRHSVGRMGKQTFLKVIKYLEAS